MGNTSIRIKDALKIRDMKQSELCKLTGISKGALSSYISGTYEPKQRNIYKIAEALDVNEAWLMGYDVPMERNLSQEESDINYNLIESEDSEEIGILIKNLRIEKGLSQEELASQLGLKAVTINKYENGHVGKMKISIIQKMAEIFDVSPAVLMGWIGIEDDKKDKQKTKKLRDIIIKKYGSIQEFSKVVNIPSTTLTSYLDRGVGGMAVDRVIKICDILNIDIKTFDTIKECEVLEIEDINNKNVNIKNKDTISIKERKLLNSFNNLNETGKDEAIKRVSELTLIPSYIKEQPASDIKTIAAHNDHLTEHGEMDKIMQDIEDMDNW
ncbi:helix-turn-helix domain-containing protein [Paraclostridium sordellii]|uniref:helix-turn-helix domain-containing protein n=1 Tax=Paraclostridium sordellii TaxID=1505 RepID=UPI0005EA152C|nr:helix-turn-helix domain-containing protein [Paeniclostridium sordellii]CEQ27149.1 putative transcriptional regulator [[Clostridium] sordellii] [Paeniclostridium sordellii]